jgi:hypothetical protein
LLLDEALAAENRSREDIQLYVGPNRNPITTESVAAFTDLGVEQLIVPLGASTLEKLEVRTDALLAVIRG